MSDNTIALAGAGLDRFLADEAVTQKFAFLGRSGSGKSYAFGVLVEGLVRAKQQVVIVDPVGVHFGLRLSADGKGEGLSIPVFGGVHGDLPLLPNSGPIVADLVVSRGVSAVLDVSEFSPEEQARFVVGFCDLFFHLKKKTRSPVHIGLEEAHEFAPETTNSHAEQRMRASIIKIAKLGRNYGIGLSVISQRPQDISKKVLNQTECVLAFQTSGAHERKAIAAWVTQYVGDVPLTDQLPTLPVGSAVLYSPQWLRVTRRVQIAKKHTYDASSTPKAGEANVEPRPLTDKDLSTLRESMAAVEDEVKQNDPKELRAETQRLHGALKEAEDTVCTLQTRMMILARALNVDASAPFDVIERAVRTLLVREDNDPEKNRMKDALQSITGLLRTAKECSASALDIAEPLAFPKQPATVDPMFAIHQDAQRRGLVVTDREINEEIAAARRERERERNAPEAYASLRRGAREMLKAIAGRAPQSLTREQCATLAGLSSASGTFGAYLSDLKKAGLISDDDGDLMLSDAGYSACRAQDIPTSTTPNPQALRALWMPKFRAGARRMLDQVVHHPTGIKRSALAKAVDIAETSGTFGAYLSDLRRNNLIVVQRDGLVLPSPELVEVRR